MSFSIPLWKCCPLTVRNIILFGRLFSHSTTGFQLANKGSIFLQYIIQGVHIHTYMNTIIKLIKVLIRLCSYYLYVVEFNNQFLDNFKTTTGILNTWLTLKNLTIAYSRNLLTLNFHFYKCLINPFPFPWGF